MFPMAIVAWPSCLFGMLTSALHFAGGYLSRSQVRFLRDHFQRTADASAVFAGSVIGGVVYGGGNVYLFDALQGDVQPVSFTTVHLAGFTSYLGDGARDLASVMVRMFRGSEGLYAPHAYHRPSHTPEQTLKEFIVPWLYDTAVTGTNEHSITTLTST